MRLLLLTPFLPYPEAAAGAPRAIFDRLLLLSPHHDITVATLMQQDERGHLEQLRKLGIRAHAVVRPSTTSPREVWRKRAALAWGIVADPRPMLVQEFDRAPMRRLVLLSSRGFDLVLVEHILAAQYIAELKKSGAPVILTEHDPRAAFPPGGEPAQHHGPVAASPLRLIDRMKWRRYAAGAYRRADLVLLPTGEDARLVAANVPGTTTDVVPFGMVSQPTRTEAGDTRDENTLLFVGNYDHPPNRDAAMWLGGEIMPLVWRQRPSTRLLLVGKNPTPGIKALSSQRVEVTGEVPSVSTYLQRSTLFVAPLRSGGGMRMKLLEALSSGIPIVTTPLGAHGLEAVDGVHLLLAEDTGEMAAAIVRALGDPQLRGRLGSAGQMLVAQQQDRGNRAAHLNSVLERVVAQSRASQTGSKGAGG
ncbi:MAG TPA: glycosyltransferase family 4 protein [Chloroflexia bacterium]|nr:glycosyltransferase family 4 protein [Chloroflexia bacterium]